MVSIVFVVVFAAVMVGVGWPAAAWMDRSAALGAVERAAVSFLTGCYLIYFGVFVIAPYRLDGAAMWGLAAAAALISLPGLRRIPWGAAAAAVRAEARAAAADPWTAILWLTAIAVALASLVQGMAPPTDYDSLAYHLAMPRYEIELGRSGIAWDRVAPQAFFPAMTGNLSRFALATMNDGVAQMLHGLFGIAAALGAALLTLRLGFAKRTALLAAVFFLALRVVVWQMATAEVDTPLAAFAVFSLLVYLAWRGNGGFGLALLFGLMLGGAILTKYVGFAVALAFAPLMLVDAVRHKRPWLGVLGGPLMTAAVIAPHLARNFLLTGNPIFPLFNAVFNPGRPDAFAEVSLRYGTGRGLLDLLTAPWNMFVVPMHYFDGMVVGAPYLLVFAPLIVLDRDKARRWLPALSVVLVYFLLWFWTLSQQVRFLLPVMPVLVGVAAVGAGVLWERVRAVPALSAGFVALAVILAANQAMFVGVYGAIRLPAALGFMDVAAYHANTPTMRGDYYKTCSYIREHLRPGERYYSLLQPHSYYCPQAAATRIHFRDEGAWWLESDTPPPMSFEAFVRRLDEGNYRYFILVKVSENRMNETARPVMDPIDITKIRFGAYLKPAFDQLEPVAESRFAAVYDGRRVIELLKKKAGL